MQYRHERRETIRRKVRTASRLEAEAQNASATEEESRGKEKKE